MAVPVAVLMVLIGKRWEWIVALFRDHLVQLLVSFSGSYVIVVVVSGYAHWANRWLDTQSSWQDQFKSRLLGQLAMPLVGGWVLSILLAFVLFACFGVDIHRSGYLRFEVWIVLLLLSVMNAGYAVWYLHKYQPDTEWETAYIEVTEGHKEKRKLRISELDIGCIQAANGFRLVRTIEGDTYFTNKSIVELEKILNPKYFYKLKRKYLINITVIRRLTKNKTTRLDRDSGSEMTVYSSVVTFGNEQMGLFEETLVKGTVKHFETWWNENSEKKKRRK
ncbi:hypothetical protein GCM10011386_03080 [Parapedobacter defluvii]|uniref:HTH LytTR-type domain-containing protein n=1 Tax=Parapedobacter defluvii TaxID=2045106 RepID=A0ABQ1KYW2_9SPHI|nr:LytTR family transcriptional regulator DNA-binding domain-containing protein [Parapedobacter defluvii]GGC14735.1 hypothetical protein GCM10011386_03080 [Parapedobacter defluvii]